MFCTTNIMLFPLEDPQKKREQGKIPIPEAEVNTLVENKREMRSGERVFTGITLGHQ